MSNIGKARKSIRNMMVMVGTVVESVNHHFGFRKKSWLRNNLPVPDKVNTGGVSPIQLSVGLPPAEILAGKALAYTSVDPGLASITNVISAEDLEKKRVSQEFGTVKPPMELFNRASDRSGVNHQGHTPSGASTLTTGTGVRPNASALTKEDVDAIVPFRKYTFYSSVDVDKYANYKGGFVLQSDSSYVIETSSEVGDITSHSLA